MHSPDYQTFSRRRGPLDCLLSRQPLSRSPLMHVVPLRALETTFTLGTRSLHKQMRSFITFHGCGELNLQDDIFCTVRRMCKMQEVILFAESHVSTLFRIYKFRILIYLKCYLLNHMCPHFSEFINSEYWYNWNVICWTISVHIVPNL